VASDLIIRNGTLVTSTDSRVADIGVSDGLVAAIEPAGTLGAPGEVIEAGGLHVLPGVIDEHVHFRQPGFEAGEDWLTGSRAAVMGGVTTVLEMPNTDPPTGSAATAREKLALAAARSLCDFGLYGLAGESVESAAGLVGSGLIVGLKVFLGPTTGGHRAPDDDALRRLLELARAADLRVGFHAEDESLVRAAEARLRMAGRMDARAHLESRPIAAEVAAIEHAAQLLHETGTSGHVFHLTSREGLAAVERWRAAGVDLTCEATPHHLLLGLDAYEHHGGVARVNPPIRGEPHSSTLLAALADGRIDCLGSDHAPHLAEAKRAASIWDVPGGFAGVETLLPLLLTEVNEGWLTLERLVSATSERPARAWKLWPRKGAIAVGSDADLTLVDLQRPGVVNATALHGKNNLTPFEGRQTVGGPVATIVRGRVVMRDGALLVEPGWGRPVNDENDQARARV
jgi:dihydroorotase